MSLGQMGGFGLGECVEWVQDGIIGQPIAQRCQHEGRALTRTKMPVLKYEIYCCI